MGNDDEMTDYSLYEDRGFSILCILGTYSCLAGDFWREDGVESLVLMGMWGRRG